MKIVQIITELRDGGAERVLVELCAGLVRSNHAVTVISLRPLPASSAVITDLKKLDIVILSVGLRKLQPWRIFTIGKLLADIRPDIVHSHLFHANLASRLNGLRRCYPLINTVHTTEMRHSKKWYFPVDRLTLKGCDIQTAVSAAARDFHAHQLGVPPESMPVVYNGIVAPHRPSQQEITALRTAWGLSECSLVIGSIGRLEHEKGFDLLLGAMREIAGNIPETQTWGVVIIGEGLERANLEQLAGDVPASIKVVLPGFRRDAARCIGAFDLFIMPSRYEGFGLALCEAMTHGIPVIASNIDSLRELLSQYANGRTFDFLHDSAESLGRLILKGVREKNPGLPNLSFTTDKMVEDYLQLYGDLKARKNISGKT